MPFWGETREDGATSSLRPRPHVSGCFWKRRDFSVLGPVHTKAFSFENAYISMRLGFTVHTNKLSVFNLSVFIENASMWKRWIKTKTHTYRISVEGRKHIKMETITENIAGVCTRIEFNLRHNVQSLFYCFERFSVDSRKRIKKVVWTRIDLYVVDDNENALV